MGAIDEIVEEMAEDAYEIYRKLFKTIKNECDYNSYMDHKEISSLAIELVPIAMKRIYGEERNDI